MTTTLSAVLQSARAKVATIATSRDPLVMFAEHTSNLPLEEAPVADTFEVVAEKPRQSAGAGLYGAREWATDMVVKLNHSAYDTQDNREENLADDIERLVDLLESHAWPDGTMTVLHQSTDTEKANANWWVTRLVFQLVWVGDLRTS